MRPFMSIPIQRLDGSLHLWVAMRASPRPAKRRFHIHAMLGRIRQEVKRFADAAMFDLAPARVYSSFDLLPAICARVSPLKRKLVQSSIAFAPICL
jgi:hypothetical protein